MRSNHWDLHWDDWVSSEARVRMRQGLGFVHNYRQGQCFQWHFDLFNIISNGSFILTDTDSGVDSDLDSKPDGYIALYKNCSHCTDSDLDPYSPFLYRTGIRFRVRTRVRLQQCK